MNILLDNCVHRGVRTFFPGHMVRTAHQAGFARLENGDLFAAAATRFDVLMTTDKNIAFQHELTTLPASVLELAAVDTRWPGLIRLGPFCPTALAAAARYRFVRLHPDGHLDRLVPWSAAPARE